MIYIKLAENNEIEVKRKFLFRFRNNFKNKLVKFKEEKIEDKYLLTIQDTKKKTLDKLSKYIRKNCISRVCLSNNLLENKVFSDFINKEDLKVCDGRWLFKYLDITEYICKMKKESLIYQEITFLIENISEIAIYNLKELASKVKIINIVTNKENQFKKIEKELYEEKGIILNINNNYKKSLIKSDIIYNYDFSEEEINKYNMPKKACIINFNLPVKINSKNFEGLNIDFFEILLPRKYLKNSLYFSGFDNSILYESYIFKNTNPSNIKKEIENDKLNINFLNGKNGRIRKNEYLNLSKKIVN